MYSFQITDDWICEQTSDSGRLSLFKQGAEAYASMRIAIDTEGSRCSDAVHAAGVFGGFIRKFHAGLIQSVTMDVIRLTGMDPSRQRIVELQKEIFGRAQASGNLRVYARRARFGGGRADPLPFIPEDLKSDARAKFIMHQDDLKIAVHSAID